MRRVFPAVGLFILSPVVGEMLLGATSIDMVALLPIMALLYGGGALFIREVVRRTGRGWCSILLLGTAYALIEEGLLDQMLFNANYSGNYDMVTVTYLPFAGTGAYGLMATLAVHAIWSIAVPIALVESLVPGRAREPWLGRVGLTVTAALFLLGAAVVGWGTYDEEHFMAPWPRLLGTAVVVALLIFAAFRIRRPGSTRSDRTAPRPVLVGMVGFASTSLYMLVLVPSWLGVAAALAIAVATFSLLLHWSRARDWGLPHTFAAAAGATLTYVWVGFTQTPDAGSAGPINVIGHVILGLLAIALLWIAAMRVRSTAPASPSAPSQP